MSFSGDRVPLCVRAQLAGPAAVLEAGADAQRYLDQLCAQLGLPVAATLVIEPAAGPESITIGERRVILSDVGGLGQDAASRLRLALYRHRELLVTQAVVDLLQQLWHNRGNTVPAGPGPLTAMLRDLVRCGCSVARYASGVVGAEPRPTIAWLENCLAAAGTPSIRILLPPEAYARTFDTERDASHLPPESGENFDSWLEEIRDGVFYQLGLPLSLTVEEDPEMPSGHFALAWHDITSPPLLSLKPGHFLVDDTSDNLHLLGLVSEPVLHPANFQPAAIVGTGAEAQRRCEESGLTTWGPEAYMVLLATADISWNAGGFMTTRVARFLFYQLAEGCPQIIAAARESYDLVTLARVLRRLLQEEVSIRNLRSVLEALLSVEGTTTADPGERILLGPNTGILLPARARRDLPSLEAEELAECARIGLRRYLSHKYTRGTNTLVVHLLERDIEACIVDSNGELPESKRQAIVDAVRESYGARDSPPWQVILLTTPHVRQRLRRIVEHDLPRVVVLSYSELSPDLNIQPISRIRLS
jgi:hypothetical protein